MLSNSFKWKHYEGEIILLNVRWYLKYPLSYRNLKESKREDLGDKSWKIEEYHRGIKQFCGVEKCQARKKESQRAHVMLSLRAFLRLEVQRIRNGISWFESKMKIHRVAAKVYLSKPKYNLNLL